MRAACALAACALAAGALVACGGNEPAAVTPAATDTPPPKSDAKSEAKSEAKPDTTAAADPAPSASAKASAAPAADKPQSSGRPAVLKSDPTEISDTFGSSPASKLELGDKDIATLRLPEGGLRTGTVVTFRIAKSGKSHGGQLGKIYEIKSVIPPSNDGQQIESGGPPFVIELPAGGKKDANLAVGVEGDKGKLKWTVVAPKRIDDSRNVAIFELTTLPSGYLHVTTKAPSGG
jgi:hypothetical protein